MTLRQRVLGWLSLALLVVYWGLGLPFSLFCLGADAEQSHSIALAYVWETPVLAILLVLLPTWLALEPVARFLRNPRPTAEEVEGMRRHAERQPRRLLRPILLGSLLGSLVSSALLEITADLPLEEVLKNVALGVPTGLLYALLAYFILTWALQPVLERCNSLVPASPQKARVRLLWKTWACLLVAGLVPLTSMMLMSYTVAQRLLESHLVQLGDSRLQSLAHEITTGQSWHSTLQFGGHDIVAVLDRTGQASYYRGPEESRSRFLQDLALVGSGSGSRVARDEVARVIVWRALSPQNQLVAVLPLTDYTAPLADALTGIAVAAAGTTLVTLALAWLLSRTLVSPLTRLTELVRMVPQRWPRRVPVTDDEIGVLGRTVSGMLTELREAQMWREEANRMLAELLEERTRKMEQLKILLGVSRSVGANLELDRVFHELLNNVAELVRASACSVILHERGGLQVKAIAGLERDRHPELQIPFAPTLMCADHRDFPPGLVEDGFQCVLITPMLGRGGAIGAVVVFATSGDFTNTQMDLLARVARLAAVAIENARLYEEKNHVSELLYRALIPTRPAFPGLQVGHRYVACSVLSGDYYDVIPVSPRRVALVMADVGGKGPEAAIQTVRAKHVVETCAVAGYRPAAILEVLNRAILEDPQGRIVTLFYGEVDLDAHTLTYCNAGHEPALLLTDHLRPLENTGVLLGAIEPLNPVEVTIDFPPGACLLLFTDGVTEARAKNGDFLGSQPVVELTECFGRGCPQKLVDELYHCVDQFSEGELGDDLTLLAVHLPEEGVGRLANPQQ